MATGLEETLLAGVAKSAIMLIAKPVATATLSGLKSVTNAIIEVFADRLTEYVDQQFEKHMCLSTIVFQHQKSLYDLYIPLTVVATSDTRSQSSGAGILIDRFRKEFLQAGSKVLVTDTAGMGKSTLSKFLFLQCLKAGHTIPFFIELRHLSEKTSVIDVITKQLNPTTLENDEPRFTKKHIQRMLKKNNLLFFFDGYDEISPAHRETVTKNIKEIVELYPQNTYVITSRPESGLLAFPAFKQYRIRPLTVEESFTLIRKYDEGAGRAEQLIKTLHGGELRSVREFLKNPLLTSLLYRSFEYKQSVPLKKHVFYRQVYDALFDWHDATKDGYNTREKKSGLDIDAFHRMMRVIGFYSVMKGKVEGDTDTVLSWIRKAKSVCNASNVSESSFLEDLVRAVPLFVKDGDLYRWSHKSLSEYFAAQYLCTEGKSDQKRTLDAIMASKDFPRFTNMLDQIYDVDNNAFREHLVLPAAKAFGEHWATTYRHLDPTISEDEVKLRRASTFNRSIVVLDKFEFDNYLEFQSALTKLNVNAASEFVNSDMVQLYMGDAGPVVIAQGAHSFVLMLLASKRDSLVYRPELIEKIPAKGPRLPKVKSPLILTDDPKLIFNSPDNFAKMTRIITNQSPTPNPEKLLRFAAEFTAMTQLTSLTDELLDALKK